MMNATVHSGPEIERLLELGLAPITDNAEALVALGFARRHPDARSGYEASLFERSIDLGYRKTGKGLRRVTLAQRAFLVSKVAA